MRQTGDRHEADEIGGDRLDEIGGCAGVAPRSYIVWRALPSSADGERGSAASTGKRSQKDSGFGRFLVNEKRAAARRPIP